VEKVSSKLNFTFLGDGYVGLCLDLGVPQHNLEVKHQLWRRRGVLVKGLGMWLKILMLCVGERRDER